ncbi:N-acetyl sugar amidotransferase [Hahella sp. HN01]|nr:N-acetyl sugar amidotransferase [Hahella sp. HN01]
MNTAMKKLKRCTRCLLPETYETIEFDANGVCNICRSWEIKADQIDWGARKTLLDQLIAKYRGKYDYDCIVPFSGGKDSTYQLYYLVKEYGVKPLVVRFNHGFMRPTIEENCTRTFKKLGVDVIEFTPNWKIVKRLMLESFRRKTDFCWHCHTGIYSYPMQIAVKFNVPLIIWGEPQAEITAYYDYLNDEIEYEDEKKFNMIRNLGISADDMYGMINSPEDPIDRRDLAPFTYPSLKDLKRIGYASVCLGSFIPWDYEKHVKVIKEELGWRTDEVESAPIAVNTTCEKIECFMQGTRDYIKYLKRGYSRITQINAMKLRRGRISLEEAERLNELDGRRPESLDIFLGYVGLTEQEFNEIVSGMVIPPFEPDFDHPVRGEPLWDAIKWYREDEPG